MSKNDTASRRRRRDRKLEAQGGLCLLCGEPVTHATVEHVVPKSCGGGLLAVSCRHCNEERGTAPLTAEQEARFEAWYNRSLSEAAKAAHEARLERLREVERRKRVLHTTLGELLRHR